EQLRVRRLRRVVQHAHRLGVAGAAAGDVFVARVLAGAAGVAGDDRGDAGLALEGGLLAPEAAAGEDGLAALARARDSGDGEATEQDERSRHAGSFRRVYAAARARVTVEE